MNIEINLLPQELRARPLVDTRTALVIVLILALAVGVYFMYQSRSDVQSENADIASRTEAMKQEAMTLSSNTEATQLINQVNQLKSAGQSYGAFTASLVGWGDALQRVYGVVPKGITVGSVTQTGNSLQIKGTASSYGAVDDFAHALDADAGFALTSVSFSTKDGYTININVAPGGGR